MNLQAIFKLPAAVLTLGTIAAISVAACGGGGGGGGTMNSPCRVALGYGGGGGGGNGTTTCATPTPAPTAAATPVGVALSGENPQNVSPYGNILGYFNGLQGAKPNSSGVVNLTASTNVQFINLDSIQHTASLLGTWSGAFPGFPASFTNTNGLTASSAGASISSSNFSTGTINPGTGSFVYSTGGPGMLIFGCAFHYLSNNMRTVVIVH